MLVGAGNAHLVFVKRWAMRPIPGVAVTLINETSVIPYSAMVPACIAGEYGWDEVTIDLVRLCQSVKIRFISDPVRSINPVGREVVFAARAPARYDALSLGLGSIPAFPPGVASAENSLAMRPLDRLIRTVEALEGRLRQAPRPFHFVVVGGGASGCELALAIHARLSGLPGFRLTLFQGDESLLPRVASAAGRAMGQALDRRQIPWRLNARVVRSEDGVLVLGNGERIAFDFALWATQAAAPPLLRESGLPVDAAGFLQVGPTLQTINDRAVFGTGDCVSFQASTDLPRNGVHAVRQGAVLFDNIRSLLRDQSLRPFRPQRVCLYLLNSADGQAIFCYGPVSWKGNWARTLKKYIDRRWLQKFTHFPTMNATDASDSEASLMRCGGCGSKISSDVLSAVLKRIDVPADPRVLLGCREGEDAAVHRVRPELFGSDPARLLEVQTVDYFKAFIDDPYLFGRIAALNSVSDLYAMNARPFSALAIATIPYARGPIQEAQLFELLSGAAETLRQLGVVLTGGHTTEGSELALGFAVTGFADEGRLFQKGNLRPGDTLLLTKPLGTGALLAAWARGECKAVWFDALIKSMLHSNGPAGEAFARLGVIACTDVTGFGLAGHLLEMLDHSKMSARLFTKSIPLYPGFEEVVARGIVSSLHRDNAKMAYRVEGFSPLPAWLFDPQTSGGLLGAVPQDACAEALRELERVGCKDAMVIGDIVPTNALGASIITLQERHG